jgi:molecular chaperone GrpE
MTQENTLVIPEEEKQEAVAAETNQPAEESIAEPVQTDAQKIEELQTELAQARAKADDLFDKLQRTVAEAQNSRRRQERQLGEEIERASARIIKRLLPVVDDFGLAFQNVPAELDGTTQAWVDGFRQIQKKLSTLMEEEGVTPIAPDGEFDPSRHEAVTSEPHETIASGHIIDTLRIGYESKGRVLRPALVRVAL